MPQSFACRYYHLVFSTKERLPLITPDVRPRLYDYLGGILRMENGSGRIPLLPQAAPPAV